MATFTGANNISPYAQTQLYTPDFSFLAKAMGTKQAQFDRGFNAVKSFYNSILNNQLTNADNEKYRESAFKKIEETMKSAAFTDLSKGQNIQLAMQAVDPISKDKDFAYDMIFTQRQQQQKQIMEEYRNSDDPDKRAMYNDYSAMSLQFADEDMQNAKRGSGEIQKIQPKRFVPFEDYNAFLNKAAKEQNIEVEQSYTQDGYIYTIKGGEYAQMAYTDWAKIQMGGRFDEQFRLMGNVQAESTIRGMMKEKGIPREEATKILAQEMVPSLIEETNSNIKIKESLKKEINNKISLIKKHYSQKELEDNPQILQQLISLESANKMYDKDIKNNIDDITKLQGNDLAYLINNLPGQLTTTFKSMAAASWGKTFANANYKKETKSDQTYLTKMTLAQNMQIHRENLKFKYDNLEYTATKDLKAQQDKDLKEQGQVSFVGFQATDSKMYAIDILDKSAKENSAKLFTNVFGNKGLIELAIPDTNDVTKYRQVASKINDYLSSENDNIILTDADITSLTEYANTIDATINTTINNKADARKIINELTKQTYLKATKNSTVLADINKENAIGEYVNAEVQLIKSTIGLYNDMMEIEKIYDKTADIVKEKQDLFKDLKITGYTSTGKPIYDMRGLPEAQKDLLNSFMPADMQGRIQKETMLFNYEKFTSPELIAIQNVDPDLIKTRSGKKIDLSNINTVDLEMLFNNMQIGFDPSSENVYIHLKPSITKVTDKQGKAIAIDPKDNITITMPYESILTNRSLTRLHDKVNEYKTSTAMLTILDDIYEDKNSVITNHHTISGNLINYTVQFTTDVSGSTGLSINMRGKDLDANQIIQLPNKFIPLNGNTDVEGLANAEKYIYGQIAAYTLYVNRFNEENKKTE